MAGPNGFGVLFPLALVLLAGCSRPHRGDRRVISSGPECVPLGVVREQAVHGSWIAIMSGSWGQVEAMHRSADALKAAGIDTVGSTGVGWELHVRSPDAVQARQLLERDREAAAMLRR